MAADRVRLSFMASPDLLARVDVARAGVPRERWLREAVERSLIEAPYRAMVQEVAEAFVPPGPVTPAPAERSRRPGPDVAAFRRATQR